MSLTLTASWHRNTQMTTTPNRNSSRSLYHHGCHMLSIIKPNTMLVFKITGLPPSRPELQMLEGWICWKWFIYNKSGVSKYKGCLVLTLWNCSSSPLFGESFKFKTPLSYRILIHTPHRYQRPRNWGTYRDSPIKVTWAALILVFPSFCMFAWTSMSYCPVGCWREPGLSHPVFLSSHNFISSACLL